MTHRHRQLASFLVGTLWACNAAALPAKEPPGSIPFVLVGLHTFIEVKLAGEKLSFVFDTGASGMALEEDTARRLDLTTHTGGTSTGAFGSVQVPVVRDLTIETGPLRLTNLTAGILPLAHLGDFTGRNVDGIIGMDILSGRVVVIDYDRSVLDFLPRPPRDGEGWGEPCRMSTESGLMTVQADVVLLAGERLEGRFFFDSGAGLNLAFNAPYGVKNGLDKRIGATYEITAHALTARPSTESAGRISEVHVCGQKVQAKVLARDIGGLPIRVSHSSAGVQALASHAGILGNGILKRYNTVIDLARRRLWLRPSGLAGEPVRVDGSGIILLNAAGQRVVDRVIKGSPAAAAGIEGGDVLLSLNGTPALEMTLLEARKRLQALGTTVELSLRRGDDTRTVTLALRLLYGN